MTSTNDEKEVKSNQTSGPKGKTYYIELYKSIEAGLSSDCELRVRTKFVCDAWRRIHSLCQHSAPSTHLHLLSWLQRHTARTVLQTEWQSPKSKDEHKNLEEAIDAFVEECQSRSGSSKDGSPQWETQLVARGEWFKRILTNPWGHPVLRILLDPRGEPPTDEEVLEWLKEERGVMFVTRLRQLAASKCDDLALALSTAVMDRVRAGMDVPPDTETEQTADVKDKPDSDSKSTFEEILKAEAGFTMDVWEFLTDIEFVLLHKGDKRSRCIELAKQTPLRHGYQLVERLQSRLETSPREKKLWKNAKEVATLIAQVVIARCMVVPVCAGGARTALYCCARSLVRVLRARLPPAARALAAPAATARHLHTLAAAVDAQSTEELKPFVCELYVRAITAGMNELERLKLKTEKESEARSTEQTLASWFTQLGALLSASERMRCECTLTAFSVNPTPAMYERIKSAPLLPPVAVDPEVKDEGTTSEFGSWASDSRSQTNFVKTSETLNLKQTKKQANVLSNAIFSEGEALGLSPEMCQDIAVLLSGPRLKTLSWDMNRELLLENCRAYMERTNFGTRALTTELKYLNLDPSQFQHLPEEEDDETDMYYGIEKGYEHLVEAYQEPEEIWQDADDPERTESASSTDLEAEVVIGSKKLQKKSRKILSSDEDSDPLSLVAEAKKVDKKKERPHSKERSKESKEPKRSKSKSKPKDPLDIKEHTAERKKEPKKKEKRERKKKEKPIKSETKSSLSCLIGMKVTKVGLKNTEQTGTAGVSVTDSDRDSQGKSSLNSIISESNETDVLFDGLFSMDELKSPEKPSDKFGIMKNNELCVTNGIVEVNTPPHTNTNETSASRVPNVVNAWASPSQVEPSYSIDPIKLRTVSDDVKKSISKLIHFRRQKAISDREQKNATPPSPRSVIPVNSNRSESPAVKLPVKPPTPVPSQISPIPVNIMDNPKVYMNKDQSNQIAELRNEVNNLLHAKTFGIARPGIQYSQKSKGLPNNAQPSGSHLPNPVQDKSLQDLYKAHQPQQKHPVVNTEQKPSTSHTTALNKQNALLTPNQNYHTFVKELHESINAGAGVKINKTAAVKKEIRPTHRVTPVVPSTKAELKTTPQCAKQFQKKPENAPNTFSRLSYLHKNKSKQVIDAALEYQNKICQNTKEELNRMIAEQKKLKLQHLQCKSDIIMARVKKPALPPQDSTQSLLMKLDIPKYVNVARDNPVITSMLQSSKGKTIVKPDNVYKNVQIERQRDISSIPSQLSSLTERDQQDLLLLLRQQSKQNLNHPRKGEIIKEMIPSPQTITENNSSSNYSVPCTSHSNKTKIVNASSAVSSTVKQLPKPSSNIKVLNVTHIDVRTPQTKPLNMVKTEINFIKTVDPNVNNNKPKSTGRVKSNSADRSSTDWEKVMDEILSHKTPCRGPNALDMALNKEVYNKSLSESLRNQRIVRTNSSVDQISQSVKSNPAPNHLSMSRPHTPNILQRSNTDTSIKRNKNRPASKPPVKVVQKSLANTATVLHSNPNLLRPTQPETPKRPTQTEKRPSHIVKDQIDVLKKLPNKLKEKLFTCPTPKEEDPFISGIPNSDYDLLEELMDDDLRQEIRELSDDESFTVPVRGFKEAKSFTISKTITPVTQEEKHGKSPLINTTPSQKKPVNKIKCDLTKIAFDSPVQTHRTSGLPNVKPVLNTEHKNVQDTVNVPSASVVHQLPKCIVAKPPKTNHRTYVVNPDQVKTVDKINTFTVAVPQQTALRNVVLIGSDIVYQPCTIQTPTAPRFNNIQRTYVTYDNQPSMAIYQTTQFAAPVVNPLIIGNAITVPMVAAPTKVSPTAASKPSDTKSTISITQGADDVIPNEPVNCVAKDVGLESKTISVNHPDNDSVLKVEKEKCDNTNRNCERKVLSEVQEKEKKSEPKNTRSRKISFDRDMKKESSKSQERLTKKRLAILNRNICHRSESKPIPLTYTPLKTIEIDSKIIQGSKYNANIKTTPNHEVDINNQITKLDSLINTKVKTLEKSFIAEEVNNSSIINNNENCKENKDNSCRRILLRSSNKINANSEMVKIDPRKTKVRLKPAPIESADKAVDQCADKVKNNKLKIIKNRVTKKTLNKVIKKVEMKRKSIKIQPKRNAKAKLIMENKTEQIPEARVTAKLAELVDLEEQIIGSKIPKISPESLEISCIDKVESEMQENEVEDSKIDEFKNNTECSSPSILDKDSMVDQLIQNEKIVMTKLNSTITSDDKCDENAVVTNKHDDKILESVNKINNEFTNEAVENTYAEQNVTNSDVLQEIESYIKKLEHLKTSQTADKDNNSLDLAYKDIMFSTKDDENSLPQLEMKAPEDIPQDTIADISNIHESQVNENADKIVTAEPEIICIDEDDNDLPNNKNDTTRGDSLNNSTSSKNDVKNISKENRKYEEDTTQAYKDAIKIEHLPQCDTGDPQKKCVRIKLPSGRTFKATVHAHKNSKVDIDTLFSDPALKSVLMGNISKRKNYTLNIKQISTTAKTHPDKILDSRIQEIYLQSNTPQKSIETIDLLSDSEEENTFQFFTTEFGKFKVRSMKRKVLAKHQNMFDMKSVVKLKQERIEIPDIAKRDALETSVIDKLILNEKLPSISNIPDSTEPIEYVAGHIVEPVIQDSKEIQEPVETLATPQTPDIIEIDDSSNDEADVNELESIKICEDLKVSDPVPIAKNIADAILMSENMHEPKILLERNADTIMMSEKIDEPKLLSEKNAEALVMLEKTDRSNLLSEDTIKPTPIIEKINKITPLSGKIVKAAPSVEIIKKPTQLVEKINDLTLLEENINEPALVAEKATNVITPLADTLNDKLKPVEDKLNEFRNLLFKDLGIIDFTDDASQQSDDNTLFSFVDAPIVVSDNEASFSTSSPLPMCPPPTCFVKLTKCDDLVRKYENLKLLKQCFIKLIRCDQNDVSCADVPTGIDVEEITDKVIHIREHNFEEPALDVTPLSRYGSFSILTGLDIFDNEQTVYIKETDRSTSPVIEAFEMIASVNMSRKTAEKVQPFAALTCETEWFLTKPKVHLQCNANSIDDHETNKSFNVKERSFSRCKRRATPSTDVIASYEEKNNVPPLTALVSTFFQNNPIVSQVKSAGQSKCNNSILHNLKRKSIDAIQIESKISKTCDNSYQGQILGSSVNVAGIDEDCVTSNCITDKNKYNNEDKSEEYKNVEEKPLDELQVIESSHYDTRTDFSMSIDKNLTPRSDDSIIEVTSLSTYVTSENEDDVSSSILHVADSPMTDFYIENKVHFQIDASSTSDKAAGTDISDESENMVKDFDTMPEEINNMNLDISEKDNENFNTKADVTLMDATEVTSPNMENIRQDASIVHQATDISIGNICNDDEHISVIGHTGSGLMDMKVETICKKLRKNNCKYGGNIDLESVTDLNVENIFEKGSKNICEGYSRNVCEYVNTMHQETDQETENICADTKIICETDSESVSGNFVASTVQLATVLNMENIVDYEPKDLGIENICEESNTATQPTDNNCEESNKDSRLIDVAIVNICVDSITDSRPTDLDTDHNCGVSNTVSQLIDPDIVNICEDSITDSQPTDVDIVNICEDSITESQPIDLGIVNICEDSISDSQPTDLGIVNSCVDSITDSRLTDLDTDHNCGVSNTDSQLIDPDIVNICKDSITDSQPTDVGIVNICENSITDSQPLDLGIVNICENSIRYSQSTDLGIVNLCEDSITDSQPTDLGIVNICEDSIAVSQPTVLGEVNICENSMTDSQPTDLGLLNTCEDSRPVDLGIVNTCEDSITDSQSTDLGIDQNCEDTDSQLMHVGVVNICLDSNQDSQTDPGVNHNCEESGIDSQSTYPSIENICEVSNTDSQLTDLAITYNCEESSMDSQTTYQSIKSICEVSNTDSQSTDLGMGSVCQGSNTERQAINLDVEHICKNDRTIFSEESNTVFEVTDLEVKEISKNDTNVDSDIKMISKDNSENITKLEKEKTTIFKHNVLRTDDTYTTMYKCEEKNPGDCSIDYSQISELLINKVTSDNSLNCNETKGDNVYYEESIHKSSKNEHNILTKKTRLDFIESMEDSSEHMNVVAIDVRSDLDDVDTYSNKCFDKELPQTVLSNTVDLEEQIENAKSSEAGCQDLVSVQNHITTLNSFEFGLSENKFKSDNLKSCVPYQFTTEISVSRDEDDITDSSPKDMVKITQQIGEDDKIEEIEIKLNVPKITYSKRNTEDIDFDYFFSNKKTRTGLKRKGGMTDVKICQKKYRKGKNIDYPKITYATIRDSTYGEEFRRLFEYCSSVQFSYSRPFHKECIDVSDLLKSWPIQGTSNVVVSDTEIDERLFIDMDTSATTFKDPTEQTLAEEIVADFNESEYSPSDINETNFSMGFGEGSDRVIQNLEDGCGAKFSAATLSDVKQTQPLLLSENYGNCNRVHNNYTTIKDEIEKIQRNIKCIQIKDKLRSFFKNTMTELSNDLLKERDKDNDSYSIFDSSDLLYSLTKPNFIQPPPFETIVQVVQVGQLSVSAGAQNPVTCDPRVTQVSDASPSQCSDENSPNDDPQSVIKTEYTELTTADLSMSLAQEYVQHIQSMPQIHSQGAMNYAIMDDNNYPLDIKPEIKIELEETLEVKEEINENYENMDPPLYYENSMMNNVHYSYESNPPPLETNSDMDMFYSCTEKQYVSVAYLQEKQEQEQRQRHQQNQQYQQHDHQPFQHEQQHLQHEHQHSVHAQEQEDRLLRHESQHHQLESLNRQHEQQNEPQEQLRQQLEQQHQFQEQQHQQHEQMQQQNEKHQQDQQQKQLLLQQQQQQQQILQQQQQQLLIQQQQQIQERQQQQQLQERQQQQQLQERQQQQQLQERLQQQQLQERQQQQQKLQQQQQLQQQLQEQQKQHQQQMQLQLQEQQKQQQLQEQKQQQLQEQQKQQQLQEQQKQQQLQEQQKQQKLQEQQKQQQLKEQKQQQLQEQKKQQHLLQKQLQEQQKQQQQKILQQQKQQQEHQHRQQPKQKPPKKQQQKQQRQQRQQQQQQQQQQQPQPQQQQQQQQQQQLLQQQQQISSEKTDQIAHAMSAAGITSSAETISNSRAHALVNILSQKLRQGAVAAGQVASNNYPKTTSINAMALQQALAQILPPPLNQTNVTENNQQAPNTQVTPQVLHIVQGKTASGNQQITLVDNTPQSVISTPNATPVLHIVQNKATPPGPTSNGTPAPQTNSFSGLSLVDGGLQPGNQLLHIVNTGNQKNSNASQLLKRVNLLTNLANVQGGNEQKMVQFVCKSADGKAIQLNAPHQRSMVLRLQPVETPGLQPTQPKQSDPQDLSPTSAATNNNNNNNNNTKDSEIKSRSVYEENYAKFIQHSSNKTSVPEKSTSLPKFNQAFGKQIYQDGGQKTEVPNSNTHLPPNGENSDSQPNDNAISLEHISQISSPPLLLRKPSAPTSQSQPNLVQQLKQTIAPMSIHGGVIYTRQIPVNIGNGQTINLITVPSSELIDDSAPKHQGDVKFLNQGEVEPSIIKIVPQTQANSNSDVSGDENNSHMTNDNSHTPQPQQVLTQMRIKLPMLSKAPQMVSGTRVVRPSFFQIQRNVIGGANQPVYQQLVLTAAPPLGQQTVRLPQAQTSRPVKTPSDSQSSTESMSSSTLEQLREFDLVLEQVKERSTVQPNTSKATSSGAFSKLRTLSTDTIDSPTPSSSKTSSSSPAAETSHAQPAPHTQHQVLYSIGNTQPLNVAYVNRKASTSTSGQAQASKPAPTPTTSSFVRSPDSSGIIDSPTSSTSAQIPHTVTSEPSTSETPPAQTKSSKGSKSKSRPKASSNPPNTLKLNTVPPKPSSQKPLEDEQTTQRILYILAEYKEQVENSPDKDKPAPRRRTNPPSTSGSSKRKKSSSGCRRGRDMSPIHGEDTCRTMGSEDSSCGTSQGDCNESCIDSHSPQDSPRKVVRKLTFEQETPVTPPRPQPQRNVIVADGQTITVARGTAGKPTTAVLMPANYILPVSMVKGGQQIAIVTNRGPKLLTVSGGEGGTTNALLLQRLIGPAGLKPVLARPGVRHVRLPAAALHNLQAFNLATTTTVQPPDSTASPAPAPAPPELVQTRAHSSPWRDRQDVKPDRGSSPDGSEPWHLPASSDLHDYGYEETVRTESMDRTVLDPIPDRYSPDMEAQRIFDKMFDVDSKKSYMVDSHDDSPRCGYDIDASDCDDKAYHQVVQKKDGSHHRQHRLTHVSAAALRHKYAILEHELRLQKSLSEECEDLGVDSPSASELFPEAELLFAASPAHDHMQDHGHHSHTPQPILTHSSIPQPDLDDQIATDQLLPRGDMHDDRSDLGIGLEDVGIVTVSEDGMQATIELDQEEFARSHPNTTFHSEPTEDGVVQHPFTITGIKGRHITSTIFHANRAPGTVLMTAPSTTVISQATAETSGHGSVKYTDIDNMINCLPGPHSHTNNINLSSVLVKDDGLTRFDSILNDNRELHLSNTASAIVHATGNTTQVIRRVCYTNPKRPHESRYLMEEPESLKMMTEDSRDFADVDDDGSSPERHTELFWESNSVEMSERTAGRRPLDFSSDSDKCCKSPSFDEANSTDSSGIGAHMRLDSVIKEARGIERSGSADGSSADDMLPPLRTYPPKRLYHAINTEMGRSMTGKTRAGELLRSGDSGEVRRRASGRGVVKRGCHCCNGSPAPPRPKKPRQKKPHVDFASTN